MAGKRRTIFAGVATKRLERNGVVVIEGADYLRAALDGVKSKLQVTVQQVCAEEAKRAFAPRRKKR